MSGGMWRSGSTKVLNSFILRAGEDDGADLGHAVVHRVEAGRLYIEGDKLRIERELALCR